ncbi:MAG: hypothetical protein IT384_18460 [Deltaproteobacteria bacterium]|nr:hypothetical protein [Deltaproteobacteria bacterium]
MSLRLTELKRIATEVAEGALKLAEKALHTPPAVKRDEAHTYDPSHPTRGMQHAISSLLNAPPVGGSSPAVSDGALRPFRGYAERIIPVQNWVEVWVRENNGRVEGQTHLEPNRERVAAQVSAPREGVWAISRRYGGISDPALQDAVKEGLKALYLTDPPSLGQPLSEAVVKAAAYQGAVLVLRRAEHLAIEDILREYRDIVAPEGTNNRGVVLDALRWHMRRSATKGQFSPEAVRQQLEAAIGQGRTGEHIVTYLTGLPIEEMLEEARINTGWRTKGDWAGYVRGQDLTLQSLFRRSEVLAYLRTLE